MDFAPPSVAYACSCSQTVAPITSLLFCRDCVATRCARCVTHETACYYCPLCLFEVPSSSVKNERNRCARNCFECPVCRSSLSVMAEPAPPGTESPASPQMSRTGTPGSPPSVRTPIPGTGAMAFSSPGLAGLAGRSASPGLVGRAGSPGPSSPSMSSTSLGGAPAAPPVRHFLQCGLCRWDSRDTGIVFERATGLGGVLLKREEGSSYAREFSALKTHYEGLLQARARAPTSTSRISSPHLSLLSPSYNSIQRHLAQLPSRAMKAVADVRGSPLLGKGPGGAGPNAGPHGGVGGKQGPDAEPYTPQRPYNDSRDDRRVEKMRHLQFVEEIPTLQQRLNQPLCDVLERLLPLRTHLRAKLAKRCGKCNKQLIKPEPKAQATQFKIKHVALAHLPNITLAHPLPMIRTGYPATLLLRFTNPLEEDLQVSLIALDSLTASVHLVVPQFSVPAYNAMQEYDNSLLVGGSEDEELAFANPTLHGVVQVKGNSVVVEVHVTPRGGFGSPVEFQLVVNYAFSRAVGGSGGGDESPAASPLSVRRIGSNRVGGSGSSPLLAGLGIGGGLSPGGLGARSASTGMRSSPPGRPDLHEMSLVVTINAGSVTTNEVK
ncbi:hypothetical protein GGF31_006957 [Allomyces arbusculus]|nr:hypothetical protein GGF31_006957 [Allomyces arbusculus]